MLTLAAVVAAAGALSWPAAGGRLRLTALGRATAGGRPAPATVALTGWARRRCNLLLAVLAGVIGVLLAGPGGGLAAAMMSGTALGCWRVSRGRRAAATAATGLSDALGILVAELWAGAHPAGAMQAAADIHTDGSPGVPTDAARALAAVAATARLGGDVPAALRNAGPASLRCWLDRLAQAWSLAELHGIALADVLDAVRCDTEHRVRFAAEVQARLAGPRSTAMVLAGLPVLGLLLGQALGAAPWRVLRETPVGQLLLVIGTALACAGVWWSTRLMSRAVAA